jgi:hypothetical protein
MILCDHNAARTDTSQKLFSKKASIISKIRVREVANFESGRESEECGTLISASEVTAQGCAVVLRFISAM